MKPSHFCSIVGIFILVAALIAPAIPTQYPAQAIAIFSNVGLFGGIFFSALAVFFASINE